MLPQKQQIAVFSFAYEPFVGGAEVALREITHRIKNRRFTVFTYRFSREWESETHTQNVDVVRVGRGTTLPPYERSMFEKCVYIWKAWRRAERMHREKPFRGIWAIMASYGGIAALLFKVCHPEIPFLLTLQEGDSEKHILQRVGVFYFFWKKIFKRADHIQVISKHLAEFAKRYGATCPIDVIPNGVDIEKLSNVRHSDPPSAEKNLMRSLPDRQAGFATLRMTHVSTIVTTSRLVHKNGIDVLLRAVALLRNYQLPTRPNGNSSGRITNYRLIIAGGGPLEGELKNLAQELGIAERVEFLGSVSAEEISAVLARGDVFVRPSRSEGLGSSFLEAMAAGLPVIGTEVGGIPDFLRDPSTSSGQAMPTGLFARVDDPEDLAKQIERLLTDDALRARLIKNGIAFIAERFGWDHIASEITNIFNKIFVPSLLIVSGIFPPQIGGSATWSAFMKRTLSAKGVRVGVLTYGETEKEQGIYTVSSSLPKGLRHIVFAYRLLRLGKRYERIIAADSSFGAATVGAFVAGLLKRSFTVRVTGDYAWEQGQQRFGVRDGVDAFQAKRYGVRVEMLRACQRFTVRHAENVIAPSEYLKTIVHGWGANQSNVVVIHNPVEVPPLMPREEARKRLGLRGIVMLSAGRLVPWKGFDGVIRVSVELKKRHPDFTLIIIGEGPERSRLEALRDALHAPVQFRGVVDKEILGTYLSAADVFVLLTQYEGFSHHIVEAVGAGLPVVTTRAGGNPELLVLFPHDIFFTEDSVDAVVGVVEHALVQHKTATHPYVHRVMQNYSVEAMVKKYSNLFDL